MTLKIPKSILASRQDPESECFSVHAKRGNNMCRVRLNIEKLFHYVQQKQQQMNAIGANTQDQWKPGASVCRDNKAWNGNNLEGDGDIWVECQYQTITQKTVFYFRSIRTNRCVLWDAPSGAGVVICYTDLHHFPFLKAFAHQPLDRDGRQIETRNCEEPKFHLSGGFLSMMKSRKRKLRLQELEEIERNRDGEPPDNKAKGWNRRFRWNRKGDHCRDEPSVDS